MEVSEAIRQILMKTSEWGLSVFVLKLDVFRAFDSMYHEHIETALLASGVNPRIVHSIMRELSFGEADLIFGDQTWEQAFEYSKGGRQGGCDTPEVWNRYLDVPICKAAELWAEAGCGLVLPCDPGIPGDEVRVDFLAWADDLFLVSRSLSDLKEMWSILSDCIAAVGLRWKPGSLEILSNVYPAGSFSREWTGAAGTFVVQVKATMVVLGICLDSVGSTVASVHLRVAEAWRHFYARQTFNSPTSV